MPIINLKIQGKQAVGDGTKIVCMNGDYKVRLECIDCEEFTKLPVKKLVLKCGTDYEESDINSVTEDNKTYLQAVLPIVEQQKQVELGVYGKQTEKGEPVYTSKSAVFECDKSILSGAIVLKKEPDLEKLDITANGKYLASERDIDGFYEVNVSVGSTPSEVRTVELSMAGGSQVIDPSSSDRVMSQVIVNKPIALAPENIRAGYTIGGVVGTYDKILTETEVYSDGEYLPPKGTDGFSKVVVNVASSNFTKALRVGESFVYKYSNSVNIVMDTPGVVKYENSGEALIFTAISPGNCSIVLKDLDKDGKIANTAHYAITVDGEFDYLLPVEADSPLTMETYLDEGVTGGVIKYTGVSSSGFVKNGLYIIVDGD
jgi:hypothetical protein